MAAAKTAQTAEQDAREFWEKAGKTLRPVDHNGRAALIVASHELAEAVVALLGEAGHEAVVDHVVRDPALVDAAEVMGMRLVRDGHEFVVPMVPGADELRIYSVPAGEAPLGTPVAAVHPVVDLADVADWIPATAIAHALTSVSL